MKKSVTKPPFDFDKFCTVLGEIFMTLWVLVSIGGIFVGCTMLFLSWLLKQFTGQESWMWPQWYIYAIIALSIIIVLFGLVFITRKKRR